jgi:hypothetical protein
MPKRKKHSLRHLPPCPDPATYILVKTKEGNFWRRKRGTVTKAALNTAFKANSRAQQVVMPAASRILRKLEPHTRSLSMGRITIKMAGKLLKKYKEKGYIHFAALEGMELQEEYPLDRLLQADYSIKEKNGELIITIDLKKGMVKPQNALVTEYYFEAIVLYGNALKEKGLRIHSVESPLFSFRKKTVTICELRIDMPPAGKPWLLLLKVNCLEGNELAHHHKNYAMKVVKAHS